MMTVPWAWVAVTRAMLIRSGGKAGQGASSILGTAPPKSDRTRSSCSSATTRSVAAVGRGGGIVFQVHAHAQAVDEDHLHHAQVFGHDADDAQLAGRYRAQADEAAHLDEVGADVQSRHRAGAPGRGW